MRPLPSAVVLAILWTPLAGLSFLDARVHFGNAMASEEIILPVAQRTALNVTLYGNDAALIWDRRPATLSAGANRLAFEGVSRQMLPSSAMISAERMIKAVDVSYDFALLTRDALLQRALGREIGILHTHPTTGEETVEKATLVSLADGPMVKYRDRFETIDAQRLVFFDVPSDLRPQPTLVATVHSDSATRTDVALGYLTGGLGWSADYVALWDDKTSTIEVTGRATLTNASGADFPAAEVSLVAGEVRREAVAIPAPAPMSDRMRAAAPMMAEAKQMPEVQELAALHLYKVPGRVDLAHQQTKQVTLLSTPPLPVEQEYISEAPLALYRLSGEPQPTHPVVRLRFAAGDGKDVSRSARTAATPLPAGLVRVYLAEPDGMPRLIGEDRIDHTPAGALIRLTPGEAFDLTVVRKQTAFTRAGLQERVSEAAWTIDVTNARDKPATVALVEAVSGDWTILAESAPHEKETAQRLVWRLPVPANGSAQLSYRIRVQQ